MITSIDQLDLSQHYTYADYLLWQFSERVELIKVLFDVRLIKNAQGKTEKDIYTVIQPDICVICDKNRIDKRGCIGAPDLIVRIVSGLFRFANRFKRNF